MTSYIQRLMMATREELEAPVKSAVKEAIADAHAHNVSTVGTRDGQVVLVRPNGAAVAYPERKKRPEESHTKVKIKTETITEAHYALLKHRHRTTIYRNMREALDHTIDLAAAVGKRAAGALAKQGHPGVYHTRLHRDAATGRFIAEEAEPTRYKPLHKGGLLRVRSRHGRMDAGFVGVAQDQEFHVDLDEAGPAIMMDHRYVGGPFKVGQMFVVKGEGAPPQRAPGLAQKSFKKKSAPRKGRHIERG